MPILRGERPGIIAFLHGKMMPIWYRFRGGSHNALVSSSRDGQLLSDYLEHSLRFGQVIRGSSSKGGSAALRTMIRTLSEAQQPLLVTPDGPRGPAGIPKQGSLVAASKAGTMIVVAIWSARRVYRVHSWDRMEIPYPFSKIMCRYCTMDLPADALSNGSLDSELDRFRTLLNDEVPTDH